MNNINPVFYNMEEEVGKSVYLFYFFSNVHDKQKVNKKLTS